MKIQINVDMELKTFKKKPFYAEIILKNNPTFLKNAYVAFSRRTSYAIEDSDLIEEARLFLLESYDPMAESTFLLVKKEVYNKLLTNSVWYDYLASIAKYFFPQKRLEFL
mgnify:CR=1 FL=1